MVSVKKAIAFTVSTVALVSAEPLLRNSPFLFTHDAATGYIGELDVEKPFAETQGVDLLGQLTCGARALDIRVLIDHDGSIKYHHGKGVAWVSDQTLDSTLPSLASWGQDNPSELVLLMLSHCYTRKLIDLKWEDVSCTDSRIVDGFTKSGIRFSQDCSAVNAWTLAEAQTNAKMDNGGKMIVILGEGACLQANYDSSVKSRDLVAPYVTKTMAAGTASSQMFAVQAFVQQSFEVPLSDSAALNPEILSWAKDGATLKGVNLLEVNLICATGISISRAFGATVSDSDQKTCISDCSGWCKKYGCSPVASATELLV